MPLRLTESEAMELLVEHYARMASNPASVEQTRHSVAKLMREHSMFADLGRLVKERIDATVRAAG